jgi:SAM-dependent methyltransferase
MTVGVCEVCCGAGSLLKTRGLNGLRAWRCQGCGFVWIDRADLAASRMPACYDGYPYNERLTKQFDRMRPHYVAGFLERIGRSFGERSLGSCTFLDVGCANGEYMWAARQVGLGDVAGVEIDAAAADRARAFGQVWGELSRVPASAYDVVQVKNVLANVSDVASFLDSCVRTLKPHGVLWLDVLNWASLTCLLRRLASQAQRRPRRIGVLRPPYVINAFESRTVRRLLERTGLRPEKVQTTYLGHNQLPYAPLFGLGYVGFVGWLMGRGAMLVSDSRRPPSNGCAQPSSCARV